MAIKEYDRGARHFPASSDARSASRSRPGREPVRAKAGAPNVLFIVLDDTGLRAARLLRLADPDAQPRSPRGERAALHQHAHHGALLAEPLLHPDRAQPPLERDGLHHRGRDRLSRARNGLIPFENGFLSEILLAHGYNTFALGKWHLTPTEQSQRRRPLRSLAARPRLRALLRLHGRRHAPVLPGSRLRQPPGRRRRKTPEEGYHLTEDLVDRAIEFIADAKQVAPDKPFFLYFCPGAMHAPHHVPREWADKYKGQFDDGWDAYREKVFERQLELGVVPPGTKLSARDPDVADVEEPRRRREAALRPHDGGVRRLPRAHRSPHRPAARLPREAPDSSTTRSSWW